MSGDTRGSSDIPRGSLSIPGDIPWTSRYPLGHPMYLPQDLIFSPDPPVLLGSTWGIPIHVCVYWYYPRKVFTVLPGVLIDRLTVLGYR